MWTVVCCASAGRGVFGVEFFLLSDGALLLNEVRHILVPAHDDHTIRLLDLNDNALIAD